MARTELPWLLFGRLVRPLSLAMSGAALFQGLLIVSGETTYGANRWAFVLAGFAFLASGLLWVGWWAKSTNLMQHGLLIAAAVLAARGAYIAIGGAWFAAGFMWSVGIVGCGGSWLLEMTTGPKRWPRDVDGGEGE